MDGSAADGEDPFFSAVLLLTVVIQRLQRAGGPSPEKDREENGYQEVGQEVRQESGEEGRQEGGKIGEAFGSQERPKGQEGCS
ncbi:MAG TPA: hypothetical protein VIT87_01935 [Gemmatimonadales bacterium]